MRKATVTCPECKERQDTQKVEFLDIEEDIQGYDVMTFKCAKCGKEVKSYVRAG